MLYFTDQSPNYQRVELPLMVVQFDYSIRINSIYSIAQSNFYTNDYFERY